MRVSAWPNLPHSISKLEISNGADSACFSARSKELLCLFSRPSEISCRKIARPLAIHHRKAKQRVLAFRAFAQRLRLLDHRIGPFKGSDRFRRRVAFHVKEGARQRHLKLDLLAAPRGRGGQGRNLGKRTRELRHSFNERRALQRPLSRFAPQPGGLLDLPSLGAVTRQ
jgi:hypothetical protein